MPSHVLSRHPLLPLAACAVALLAGCATPSRQGPVVPDNLKAPAAQAFTLAAYATGVQIYECQPGKADATRYEWVFKAPQATLADRAGNNIGKHYGGPTWEANDGSKVVGAVKANDPGPDANAIPWLLLEAKSNSGQGLFGRTQSIQRVQTVGGKAPAQYCAPAEAGKEARIAYQAVYYFYGPTP